MKQIQTIFFSVAAFSFLGTGWVKLFSSMGASRILNYMDPVFGFNYRTLFALSGIFELAVAFCLLWPFSHAVKRAWAFGAFLLLGFYRLAYEMTEAMEECPCLGHLTDKLSINPALLDALLIAFLIFGLAVSGLLFCVDIRAKQQIEVSERNH